MMPDRATFSDDAFLEACGYQDDAEGARMALAFRRDLSLWFDCEANEIDPDVKIDDTSELTWTSQFNWMRFSLSFLFNVPYTARESNSASVPE